MMSVFTDFPLKPASLGADVYLVRYRRLVIETSARPMALSFHPRLTVITGVDRDSSPTFCRELSGWLLGSDDGVHLEVEEDNGRAVSIFRPPGVNQRVLDADGSDVTEEFADFGRVDLLTRYEVGPGEVGYVDRAALVQVDRSHNRQIEELASLDQGGLWSLAQRIELADADLQSLAERPEENIDADTVVEIESQQLAIESAAEKKVRLARLLPILGVASVAAIAGALATGRTPLLLAAAAVSLAGFLALGIAALSVTMKSRRAGLDSVRSVDGPCRSGAEHVAALPRRRRSRHRAT